MKQQNKKRLLLFTLVVGLVCAAILFCLYAPGNKKDEPLVSVVMPTYNRADLLPRSIESILNQTYRNLEFIIVDDGSTDDSVALIESYQKKDPRIVLLRNETNRGISYTRNKGNRAAKGKYIAIMDSDDFSQPQRLQRQVELLEARPEFTAVNSIYTSNDRDTPNNWVPYKRLEIIMNFRNFFTHLAMVRRDFLVDHGISYNENMMSSEDYDLWRQVITNGGRLYMLNEPLLILRRHRTNSMEYYREIERNRKVISGQLLARFGISADDAQTLNRCALMHKMVEANPDKKLVDQRTLVFTYKKECTKENLPQGSLYIKHEEWLDNLIPLDAATYKREGNGDIAHVIYRDPERLILRWDNGDEETFLYKEKSWMYAPNAKFGTEKQ
ncbi:MAG: glycosyltransferase [Lactobacillales bacterium]|jgi:glycosyltransferase involved in cell wall biosynthesis|nr:glycosyltransferase [Lactobacillales bacterium]